MGDKGGKGVRRWAAPRQGEAAVKGALEVVRMA